MKKTLQLTLIALLVFTGWSNNAKAIMPNGSPIANFTANTNSTCVGGSITFTDLSSNSPSSWSWTFIGGTPSTSTSENPVVTYNTAGSYAVTLTATNANGSGTLTQSGFIVVTSGSASMPGFITGPSVVCPNTTTNTYFVSAVAGVSYNWTTTAGASILSGQGTNSVSVSFSNFTTGSISVTASNGCGTSAPRTLSLSSTLPTPGTISGSAIECGGNSATYTITAVSGATSYFWTAPLGASIQSGQGTTGVIVSFSAGFTSGTLSVAGVNGCGNGASRNLSIVNTPAALGNITGPTVACGGTTQIYSVPTSAGATSYIWTLPSGATGTSSTNSITVTFPANFTSGNISVSASSGCASTTPRTLLIRSVLPAPFSITGSIYGCANSTGQYSTASISGATGYTWSVTGGATIASGQGTTSVTVGFGSSFTTGILSVTADNQCGSSTPKALTIKSTIGNPASIQGPANGLCISGISTAVYSVPVLAGAVSYNWTVPTGASIVSGQGSNSITVSFGSSFTSGNVTVTAFSPCNIPSLTITLAIHSTPLMPGLITGQNTGLCNSTATYSISPVTGATSYTWTTSVPGATVVSSNTSPSATITFPSFTTGTVSVTANNDCGSSAPRTITVTGAPAEPGVITGETWTCGLNNTTYTISPVANATTYTWSVPSPGVTIVSGQGTTSLTVHIDTTFYSGNITVFASNGSNGCNSVARSLHIASTITPGPISGPSDVTGLSQATYSIAPVPNAVNYVWSETHSPASAGITLIPGTNGTSVTAMFTGQTNNYTGTGTIKVVAIFDCSISRDITQTPSQPVVKVISGVKRTGKPMYQMAEQNNNSFSQVYPNPTTNEFIIDATSDLDNDVIIEVYDVLGNKMLNKPQHLASGVTSLKTSIEGLTKGMYFVRLIDADNNILYKQTVVKE